MKKCLYFILITLSFNILNFINLGTKFYKNLTLPFFAVPYNIFTFLWIIILILISISVCQIITENKIKDLSKNYKIVLLTNYIEIQLLKILPPLLNNTFIIFILSLFTFISSLFLYQETTYIKEKSTKYLDLYVLLSLYITITSITIYVLNTH